MSPKKETSANWYLLYTNPRSEKRVAEELNHRGYHVFLPLQKTLKQWSDRKKWVEEPLFKSYVFIEIQLEKHYYDVLNVPGIVKFVNFEKSPVIVDFREIEFVKKMIGGFKGVEAFSNELLNCPQLFACGELVEVITGPLSGAKGKMVQINGKSRITIELGSIGQNVVIQIPQENVRKIEEYNVELNHSYLRLG